MMSLNDALEAWQAGEISVSRAMRLTGARDVMELHAFSEQSGVNIRTRLLPREEEQAKRATDLVDRTQQVQTDPHGSIMTPA